MAIETDIGDFDLMLTASGNITDLDFTSNAGSVANPLYNVPGDFKATLEGTVMGSLVNVPVLGNINLGTIFTIDPTDLMFAAAVEGTATLSDLDGVPPFPNDMLANFAAAVPFDIPVPVALPVAVAISQSIPNGQSGFSELHFAGSLDAELTLGNPSYDLSGTELQVLVPEPGSIALASFGVLGLAAMVWRRKRAI